MHLAMLFALTSCNNTTWDKNHTKTDSSLNTDLESKHKTKSIENGWNTYSIHCNRCHQNPKNRSKDNYSLIGLFNRLPSPAESWFIRYVQNSRAMEIAGDEYAIALAEEHGHAYEHLYQDTLTELQLKQVIRYIQSWNKNDPAR